MEANCRDQSSVALHSWTSRATPSSRSLGDLVLSVQRGNEFGSEITDAVMRFVPILASNPVGRRLLLSTPEQGSAPAIAETSTSRR